MTHSISCKELGMDCQFVAEAETGEAAIDLLMRHVQSDHGDDWYEMEEIYQAARTVIRNAAA
jgi:predicted small metal-binding protein